MGNSPPVFDAAEEKKKLEINCFKIKGYLEIYRDRKFNDARAKEKSLIKAILSPTRSRPDEIEKARIIIGLLHYVKACDILIRYSEVVRTNSMNIIESRKDHQKIIDLIPFLETIIWSVKYMGIDNLVEFQNYILYLFGQEFTESIEKSQRIDPDLKVCFENVVPTQMEVNNYYVDMANRNNMPLEKINEVGHEFARTGSPPPPNFQQPPPFQPFEGNNGFGAGNGGNNGNQFNFNNGGNNNNYNNNFGGNNNVAANGNNNNNTPQNIIPSPEKKNEQLPDLDDFEKRLRDLKG